MSAAARSSGILAETIQIPRSPTFPSEYTMPKFRVIIEDEKSGQEYWGRAGINRVAADRIVALINSVGAHDLAAGKLPVGPNRDRKLSQWARDVAHVLDRKPPKVAPRRALTITRRTGR